MAVATGQRLAGPTILDGTLQTIYTVTAAKKGWLRVLCGHYTGAATTVTYTQDAQVMVNAYSMQPNALPAVIYEGWFNGGEAIKLTAAAATRLWGAVDGALQD